MKSPKVRLALLNSCSYKRIRIWFTLSDVMICMEDFEKMVGIFPCTTRTIFPRNSINTPYWKTEVESDADNIEEPMREMVERIKPRLSEICRLREVYNLQAFFTIMVRSDYSNKPIMSLSQDIFLVLEQLNADLIFDIAYEW